MKTLIHAPLSLILLCGVLEAQAPNVLFVAIDDLNDWIEPLGGHPQAKTPNLNRLAAEGVTFTRAYCVSPGCLPSRTAVLTGSTPTPLGCTRTTSTGGR